MFVTLTLFVARRQVIPFSDTELSTNRWDLFARRALERPSLLLGEECVSQWYAFIKNFFTIVTRHVKIHEFPEQGQSFIEEHTARFPYRNVEV